MSTQIQNSKRLTKGRAIQPDPNKSLLKFRLTWLPSPSGDTKKNETWYSYDYQVEREMFPEGLSFELRKQWQQIIAKCWKNEDLYEWLKWIRPHNDGKDTLLSLYLPNWNEILSQCAAIEEKYGSSYISSLAKHVGFDDVSFLTIDRKHPRQVGHSPGKMDFKTLYGFKYLHRNDYIVTNLASGKLLKVDVYDNLMYHSENHLHTLYGREPVLAFTEPAVRPAPQVRGGAPTPLSALIGNMSNSFNQ